MQTGRPGLWCSQGGHRFHCNRRKKSPNTASVRRICKIFGKVPHATFVAMEGGASFLDEEANSMIDVAQGDITQLEVDAIVTSANESLMGGGGVDKAVHNAAGPGLLQECMKIGICNPGQAVITGGHWLEAKKIIHTVGPVWEGGDYGEEDVLRSCYRASLELAREHELEHIAFPCIAAEVYEFPGELAARVAVQELQAFIAANSNPRHVTFCCFQEQDLEHYRVALAYA